MENKNTGTITVSGHMSNTVLGNTGTVSTYTFIRPLRIQFEPKEDITTYELALCLNILMRRDCIMPHEIDYNMPHVRHFKIHDPN